MATSRSLWWPNTTTFEVRWSSAPCPLDSGEQSGANIKCCRRSVRIDGADGGAFTRPPAAAARHQLGVAGCQNRWPMPLIACLVQHLPAAVAAADQQRWQLHSGPPVIVIAIDIVDSGPQVIARRRWPCHVQQIFSATYGLHRRMRSPPVFYNSVTMRLYAYTYLRNNICAYK